MSNISQFMASSGVEIGQQFQMPGALNNFTIGTKEFLRCGFLKSYTSAYTTFKSRVPYGGFVDCTPLSKSLNFTVDASNPNLGLYHNGTRYGLINAHNGSNSAYSHSTDGITWTNVSINDSSSSSYGHAKMGSKLLFTRVNSTNPPVIYTSDFQTWSTGSLSAGTAVGPVASNAAGTLAVIAVSNLASTASNSFYTSTDGITWTARTGTGGQVITNMYGITWSPCSNAFLVVGVGTTNLLVNKTTDGFTQTTALTDTAQTLTTSVLSAFQQYVAHSSSVTLIGCNQGIIKRTTDGSTWTTVDLSAQSSISATNISSGVNTRVWYDSVSNKFYAIINTVTYSSVAGTTLFTSTDGITWTQTFMFRDASTTSPFVALNTIGFSGVFSANSKTWMIGATATPVVKGIVDVTSKITQANPDWVGMITPTDTTQYVRIA